MDKNSVLIISEKETFSVRGLCQKLTESGSPTYYVPLNIEKLKEMQELATVIVFYMDDFAQMDPKFLVFLKDLCMEKEKSLILIGRREEYEIVTKIVPQDCITSWFERPLDMNKFLRAVQNKLEQIEIQAKQKTVLIVDDDVTYMQMIREWLKERYQVIMVNSGLKAIQWLTNNKADMILLDYEMPVTNGPQILEMLKSDVETDVVPVMFLTGQQSTSSVLTAMKLKPVDYLLKSAITKKDLLEKLDTYFAKKKAGI